MLVNRLYFSHTNKGTKMKRFATTYPNGHTVETSSAHEAQSIQNYGNAQAFFLSGDPVSPVKFFSEVECAVGAAWDKKSTTHKRVRMLHGSSAASYVEKWVKR